jgi:hypothetical protein
MNLSKFKIDAKAKEDGDWVEILGYEGLAIKTRAFTNIPARALHDRMYAKARRNLRRGTPTPPAVADNITITVLLEHCTLDWRGLTDDEGQPIPFTRETAERYFRDPNYRPLLDAAAYAAEQVGEEEADDIEAAEGN